MGCLLSVFLWNIDRGKIFKKIDSGISNLTGSKAFTEFIWIMLITLICVLFFFLEKITEGDTVAKEIISFIVFFMFIDISNADSKNIKNKEDKKLFYNTVALISISVLCGFVGVLFYTLVIGNFAAVFFGVVCNISKISKEYRVIDYICCIIMIIPAAILNIFMYLIYVCRNKTFKINFNGDFLSNFFRNPLLNINIFAAYIESINFYYYCDNNGVSHLKSYGKYKSKIDKLCIKDYLSIGYFMCLIFFMIFFILLRLGM